MVELATIVTAEGEEDPKVASASSPTDSSEEVPHARGPPIVGVEDLGLQDGKGVEMALGERVGQDGTSDLPAAESNPAEGEPGHADKDGDIVLDDTTSKEEIKAEDTTAAAPQTGDETAKAAGDSAPAAQTEKAE